MFGRRDSMSGAIKAKFQKSGYLHKLPMSSSSSERWQKRLFVAKDGFLLYYAPSKPADFDSFDTKPRGVIPLGGCNVEKVERGPAGTTFGFCISHPDFVAGRVLVLAAETEEDQKAWLTAIDECSRVTMENALLGDA